MGKFINLMGQKFGRLTIVKRAGSDKWKNATWLCKCNCGREKIISGNDLREGNTKSCGCLKIEIHKIEFGLANMRYAIRNYQNGAKERSIEWDLTEEQFEEITQKDCYYCGAKPNNKSYHFQAGAINGSYIYNGLDRVDNTKGYTINNVVPCCKICNMAKNNLTLQEFKDWIKRTYNKMLMNKGETI